MRLVISPGSPISDDRDHTSAAWKRFEPGPLARVFFPKRALH